MSKNTESIELFVLISPQHPELFNSLPGSEAQRSRTHATHRFLFPSVGKHWNFSDFIILPPKQWFPSIHGSLL